ncbi:unnamed protein product [Bursaphelenchus okinawaensis]|uniref:Tyrosine-protein kinase n=1 Tax=Bursaphelenchus okinawaensis TaxID=465554 RepID=A0A811JV77_9BILA|nr:unnamed protein product [Bursaphelenchus okinawaensis]CAG9084109.1 unnamed protein product [Bursaphelenchus okinawaensis]
MDPSLMHQPYFHGLLPREDLPKMLRKRGDFLVRTTEPVKGQPRSHVLSLKAPLPTDRESIRHFIIRYDSGTFFIHQRRFDSISKLIEQHLTSGEPLNSGHPETTLQFPVIRQHWELMHNEIFVSKQIGEGAFGAVCLGKWTSRITGLTVDCAIKQAKLENLNKEQIKEVMMEARVMRPLNHPNVVKLYGVAALQEPLMIVMEFAKQGALNSYLSKNELSVDKRTEMCFGAACGIHYLHECELLHRDIAARNCLYSDDQVKISDFGLTRDGPVYDIDPTKPIPVKWISPEAVGTLKFTYKTDVWSYGVMCYEIYSCGKDPYSELGSDVVRRVREGYRLTFPDETPQEVRFLVMNKIFAEEAIRPTMAEIVKYLEKACNLTAPPLSLPRSSATLSARTSRNTSSVTKGKGNYNKSYHRRHY